MLNKKKKKKKINRAGDKSLDCIIFSAVKLLIVINCIQNKSFCLHKICVYCVFVFSLYKYTHTYSIYI